MYKGSQQAMSACPETKSPQGAAICESRKAKIEAAGRNKLLACMTAVTIVAVAMLALGWGTTPVRGSGMSSMPCLVNSDPSASIFDRFLNDDGCVQSARGFVTIGTTNIDASNAFFTAGPNGQSCATCHRPGDGMTVHVPTIQNAFAASGGTDPLFRPNDTANRPDADVSTVDARRTAYSLTLALGVTRIDKGFPANPEFVVAPQTTDEFGTLPRGTPATLALFRRPLVNTNMRFDSAVLWDGRQSITNLRGQVKGAAKALLSNPALTDAEADDIARFQLGVFTDQVIDNRDSFPESHAGDLSAEGARGGVRNLRRRAFGSESPCLFTDPFLTKTTVQLTHTVTPDTPTYFPQDGAGSLTPSSCEEVEQGGRNMTTFRAWLSLSGNSDPELSRRRIAHGEEIFNRAVLHVPPDIVIPGLEQEDHRRARAHCTTCHATNNIGNHPDASFFVRIGSDSVKILQELADAHPETPSLQDFVTRTAMLPQYCLRSTVVGAPPLPGAGVTGAVNCGDYQGNETLGIPGDTVTSDPGRAMVTGKWVDIGKFKPPILRGLATRSPYFHGSAADSTVGIVDFYNARFNIGLSDEEKQDLVRFLEAH